MRIRRVNPIDSAPKQRFLIIIRLLVACAGFTLAGCHGAGSRTNVGASDFQWTVRSVTDFDVRYSWHPGCPVAPTELRSLSLAYWRMDGSVGSGVLVVNRIAVDPVRRAFELLFRSRFPIARMQPIDAFMGDDDASMEANNTSAFNCRAMTSSTGSWSAHAFGLAVDINPLQNPFILHGVVSPPGGAGFRDRTIDAPGMIHANDSTVRAFSNVGWRWGGVWTDPIDYQHFSATGH